MARKVREKASTDWTESQETRRKQVEGGGTVVANLRHDLALIAWAQTEGLYVRIDRRTEWGNPYEIGEDGDRSTVIESFKLYIARKHGLLDRISELRGSVLGCWCHPEPCHGCVLIALLQESPSEHDARRGLRGSRPDGPGGVEKVR